MRPQEATRVPLQEAARTPLQQARWVRLQRVVPARLQEAARGRPQEAAQMRRREPMQAPRQVDLTVVPPAALRPPGPRHWALPRSGPAARQALAAERRMQRSE